MNRKRKAKNWLRAYGSEERVAFVQALPCGVCGCGPSENAHVVKGDGGAGYKASAKYIGPLDSEHHAELHRMGPEWFQRVHNIDLAELAKATESAWLAHLDGAA